MHYCCQGCAFVAEELRRVRSGAADFSSAPSKEIHAAQRCTFPVHGMVCAACALLIEARLRVLPGVASAQLDFGAQRARVNFDAQQISEAQLRAAVEKLGYATDQDAQRERRAARLELARVLLAWLCMMQVMMLAIAVYVAGGDMAPDIEQLLRIAQLVLTIPVMLFSAVPLLRAAVHQLRARAVGMDVPIALGLVVAYAVGVWNTVQAQGAVYFDTVTMFVALVLASRWVQARALRRSQALVAAAEHAVVQPALRLRPGSSVHDSVPAAALRPGDRLWVRAGDAFAADGLVREGASAVSQAWLMGEARPQVVSPGSAVLAGAINLEAPVVLEVTRAGEATTLAALRRLMERADEARPRVMELAQRVAQHFLWVVLVLSAATALVWSAIDPTQALAHTLAVLIATCPCALSLAAPTVWSAAQARLARCGVLLTRMAALETLARVDTFAFDKTGTLTTHTPQWVDTVRYREHADALSVASTLARASNHPYALVLAAGESASLLAQNVRVTAGQGIEGNVGGRGYRLGRAEFAWARGALDEPMRAGGVLLLSDDEGPIALFRFGETLRAGAARALEDLHQLGLRTELLSGDRAPAVQRVAQALTADAVHAQLRPQDKREHLERLQRAGHCVAMMGDGMNDAPVLAQADVSFAIGSELGGAALAQTRADFIVLNADLCAVSATVRVAQHALQRVRQNFLWALVYNLGVLPLAAIGWLTPALAAVGMAASSLLVVGNALRRPRR